MRIRVVAAVVAVLGCGPALAAPVRPAPAAPFDDLLARSKTAFDNRRYAEADSLAILARDGLEAQARPDSVQLAAALVALARARVAQRILADSVVTRSARGALALLDPTAPDQSLLRADAHDVLALVLDEQNRDDLAVDHGRRALALRRARLGEVDEEVAESYYRLGNIFQALGQQDSALAIMRTGLDVRLRVGIARDRRIGDFHSEIATILERLGDLDGAQAQLETTLREYESRLGPTHPAICQGLQRYSSFAYRNGEIARAVDLSQRAVQIAESAPGYNPVNLALLRGNLAIALSRIGDFARARRVGAQVVPVFEQKLGPNHRQTMWAEISLALAEVAVGDTASAVARYRDVCARIRSDPRLTSTGPLTQALGGLSELAEASHPDSALALAAAGEAAERARPDFSWATVVELEILQLRMQSKLGDGAAVDRLAERIARDLDEHRLRDTESEAYALAEQSWAQARRHVLPEAVRLARDGSRIARRLLVRDVRALPDRQGLTLSGVRSGPLDALLALATGPGSDVAAIAWDEEIRWRGLVAAEIARRRPPQGAGIDTTLLRAHAAWVQAERRLARFEVRAAGESDDATAAQLEELRARADDAERRWAAVAPRADGVERHDDIGLARVRGSLAPRAALVAFAITAPRDDPERLIAFTAFDRGPVRAIDLGESGPIATSLERWREIAGRSPQGDAGAELACREAGRALRARTWDAIAPGLAGARDVFVIAEGPLHALPWGALPDGEHGYLVERAPTIHVIEAERDLVGGAGRGLGDGLLAVGGVDFAETDDAAAPAPVLLAASTRAALSDCARILPRAFAPLGGTEREVEAIAREWMGAARVLRGAAANEAAFKALAPGRRVLHVATHAVVLEDSCVASTTGTRGVGGVAPVGAAAARRPAGGAPPAPWLGRRVFLALAGADHAGEHDRDENDGLLTAEEVSTLDLQGVEWVVLSACESGVAEVWNREGLLGLTRAFHLAGARAVIASQWAVDDESTREWMSALYAARRRGAATVADAMQSASRAILETRRRDGRGTHPFFWAAFTASGD